MKLKAAHSFPTKAKPFGIVLTLFITFWPVSSAWSQGGAQGAIVITVNDPTGAVIPNAPIDVINQDTGVTERTVITGPDGRVNVPLLPAGNYRVVVTATGFAKTEAKDIRVRVTETTTVTVSAQVGGLTQEVSVTATPAIVQLAAPTTGETLQSETVGTLPLSTRNFLTLLSLSAGANGEIFDSASIGRGSVTMNVNGQRPVNNNYQLEGINANDFNLPILDNVPLPNPQTIAEFKTQTSMYDASHGRNGGGNIEVSLKSGTDQYHGDAFEFFRNNVLNANDFFLNRQGQRRPVLRQNQFGGSLGGPVPGFRDWFIFGNYQGTRAASGLSRGTTLNTNIPIIPADRSPATLIPTFFPNGLPPGVTTLDPVALRLLNLPASKCPGFNDGTHCIPTLPGAPGFATATSLRLGNISKSLPGTFSDDQFTITSDKSFGAKDKLSFRWFWSEFDSTQPFGTSSTLSFQKAFPNINRFAKLGWTRVLSSKAVNQVRFGFNRFGFSQVPTEPITLSDIGATRGNAAEFPGAYRFNITGSGSFQIGTGVNDVRGGRFNTFVYGDDFSYSLGKHQLRAGFEADQYQLNRFNQFATRGSVTFGNTTAGQGGAGIPALIGFQNFLLGRITSTQGGAGFFTFHFRALDYAAYVQDDWRVNDRLTLNLGLRWEGLSTAYEKDNLLSNFRGLNDDTVGPIQIIHPERTARVGTPGVERCTLLDCLDTNNFAPRVGFALDLLGDQKTVLRGGYGIYYQRTSNQPLLQTSGGLPFSQAVSAAALSVTTGNPFPTLRPTSDFPLPFDQVVPQLIAFNGTTGAPVFRSADGRPLSGFFFFPVRDFKAPTAYQWNLNIQREVLRGWVAEVGYVGTRGIRLVGPGRPLNAGRICTASQPCAIPANIGSGITVPAGTPGVTKAADGTIAITESTAANLNARVPVQFLGLANSRGFFQEQAGQSSYHGLQTTLSHQYAAGLYVQAAYTYSKSQDNGSGSSFQDELNGLTQYGGLFDTKSNLGLSDFDRTHRLIISYNYELPFAKWAHIEDRGLGKLANGWSINGVTLYQSGTPFIVFDSSAITLEDTEGQNQTNKAILNPGRTLESARTSGSVRRRLDNYVDLSAFASGGSCVDTQNQIVPKGSPACTGFAAIGDVARNQLRGPFQQNWDLSIIKRTKITERTSLDFRTEFFNVWNHASFQSPQAQGGSFGNYGAVDLAGGDSSILKTVNQPRIIQFAAKINF